MWLWDFYTHCTVSSFNTGTVLLPPFPPLGCCYSAKCNRLEWLLRSEKHPPQHSMFQSRAVELHLNQSHLWDQMLSSSVCKLRSLFVPRILRHTLHKTRCSWIRVHILFRVKRSKARFFLCCVLHTSPTTLQHSATFQPANCGVP